MRIITGIIFRPWISICLVLGIVVMTALGLCVSWHSSDSVAFDEFYWEVVTDFSPFGELVYEEFLPNGAAMTPYIVHWKHKDKTPQRRNRDGGLRLTFMNKDDCTLYVDIRVVNKEVAFYRVSGFADSRSGAREAYLRLSKRYPGVWNKWRV